MILGLQKWSKSETNTRSNMRSKKRRRTHKKTGAGGGRIDKVGGGALGVRNKSLRLEVRLTRRTRLAQGQGAADLGAPALPPTRLVHTSFTPRPAHLFYFFDVLFSTSCSTSFLSHFGLTFGAQNRPKCPQTVIQNLPSQSMCPIFGFGTFFVNF